MYAYDWQWHDEYILLAQDCEESIGQTEDLGTLPGQIEIGITEDVVENMVIGLQLIVPFPSYPNMHMDWLVDHILILLVSEVCGEHSDRKVGNSAWLN